MQCYKWWCIKLWKCERINEWLTRGMNEWIPPFHIADRDATFSFSKPALMEKQVWLVQTVMEGHLTFSDMFPFRLIPPSILCCTYIFLAMQFLLNFWYVNESPYKMWTFSWIKLHKQNNSGKKKRQIRLFSVAIYKSPSTITVLFL